MSYPFENLKPESIWRNFYEITRIPRASKKEDKIREYLVNWGKSHNLETIQDEIGNVLIRKPATPGMENRKTIVLQSHMDMVCEKNSDVQFNFDTDPILPRIEGEWVKATGTTLGADNGIGVATQLAILESADIQHGPIECLITTDEETGLTGAFGLKPDLLKGSILSNLDSEDDGELFIGCAGGTDTAITLPLSKVPVKPGSVAFIIEVSGLKGGHSGDDINKGLGNANKVLNRFIWNADQSFPIELASFNGGNLRNAIAREAKGIITLPGSDSDAFIACSHSWATEMANELQHTDAGLSVKVKPVETPSMVFTAEIKNKLIQSLYACPHGVLAMSPVIPGLVETSTNLASVKTNDDHIIITTSQRSSIESAKHDAAAMVGNVFRLAGAKIEHGDGYPGWTPNPKSEILEITKSAYTRLFGDKPLVKAIHAGLECGLIGEKYPKMDMVSFGPTIKSPHSPDERIEIATVERFWVLTQEVLKNIPSV